MKSETKTDSSCEGRGPTPRVAVSHHELLSKSQVTVLKTSAPQAIFSVMNTSALQFETQRAGSLVVISQDGHPNVEASQTNGLSFSRGSLDRADLRFVEQSVTNTVLDMDRGHEQFTPGDARSLSTITDALRQSQSRVGRSEAKNQTLQNCISYEQQRDSRICSQSDLDQTEQQSSSLVTFQVTQAQPVQNEAESLHISCTEGPQSVLASVEVGQPGPIHVAFSEEGETDASIESQRHNILLDEESLAEATMENKPGRSGGGQNYEMQSERSESLGAVQEKLAIETEQSSVIAASDMTDARKMRDPSRNRMQSYDQVLIKESPNNLSSENPSQNTRAAVHRGNMIQQVDSDLSEGAANQEDSQQSSQLSQYFNNLEPEDQDQHVSISKEVILENDEFNIDQKLQEDSNFAKNQENSEASPANADLLHLNQMERSEAFCPSGNAELQECSRESSELLQTQLEYSRSLNQIEVSDTLLGAKTSQLTGKDSKASKRRQQLEKTPQFHDSSPVILEANAEDSALEAGTQQPNYESDTGHPIHTSSCSPKHSNGDFQVRSRVTKGGASALRDSAATLEGDQFFEVRCSLQILSANDKFGVASGDEFSRKTSQDIKDHIVAEQDTVEVPPHEDLIKVVEESSPANESANNKGRFDNCSVRGNNTSFNGSNAKEQTQRQSLRYSKGFDEELDRVAERINRSLILNQESVDGDSVKLASGADEIRHPTTIISAEENEDTNLSRSRESCSELPKDTRNTTRTLTSKRNRTISEVAGERRRADQILVREQDTPNSRELSSGYRSSRRNSRLREPKFPIPIEEIRQRFSTPRRAKNSMKSKSNSVKSGSLGNSKAVYPFELRKNTVIKGPVLQTHLEQMTIQNGKLKVQAKRKRSKAADDPAQTGSLRQPRKAKSKSQSRAQQIVPSSPSSLSHGDQPSFTLPQRRIKPKHLKQRRLSNEEQVESGASVSQDRIRQRQTHKNKFNLLNAKKDLRQGKKKGETKASLKRAARHFGGRKTSSFEAKDVSLMSTFEPGVKPDHVFDKKQTPRYPLPVTLETSAEATHFLNDSLHRPTVLGGIATHAINVLPIDQIYEQLSKNWDKEKIFFEQKCNKVLEHSKQEAQVTQPDRDEVRTRQHRFEILKQRLLQSSAVRLQQKKSNNELMELDHSQLNQNLKEIDKIFSNQDNTRTKPRQYGNFQFIFNKPERFKLPPSPQGLLVRATEHEANVKSQNLPRGRQGGIALGERSDFGKLRSQVLTPKTPCSFLDGAVPIIAMNMTPLQSHYHASQAQTSNAHLNPASPVETIGSPEIKGMLPKFMPYQQKQTRAVTANNTNNRQHVLVQDAFNSSVGFQSSNSVARRNHPGKKNMLTMNQASDYPKFGQTPNNEGSQQRLMQKLQQRSMRGRRIKDYLQQVQSTRVNSNINTVRGDQTKRSEREAGFQAEESQCTGNQSVHQQSFYRTAEGGFKPDEKGSFPNKLKKSNAFQSEASSNLQNSLDNLESRNKMPVQTQSSNDSRGPSCEPQTAAGLNKLTSSVVLNNFLEQQDKRVDFGLCQLFTKVRDGKSLELESDGASKVLRVAELELLMGFIKRKNQETLSKVFQQRAHSDCHQTIQMLLSELGMGYRAARMEREESQIDVKRVYVMVCRAHKLHRARIELINIFDLIIQLEDLLPRVKSLIMSKLTSQSLRSASCALSSHGSIKLSESDQREVERRSRELRGVLSQLVVGISGLLQTFKFFNDSFVFNDKDYLKYLSKETIEVKGLLNVYGIRF